jgi:hypothetical protein
MHAVGDSKAPIIDRRLGLDEHDCFARGGVAELGDRVGATTRSPRSSRLAGSFGSPPPVSRLRTGGSREERRG